MADNSAPVSSPSLPRESPDATDDDSSTDDGDVTPTPDTDSDDESTGFPDHLAATVMNPASSETETDTGQSTAPLPPASVAPGVARGQSQSSSSSEESERGARGQQFVAFQLTEVQAMLLKLKPVQRKVTQDLGMSNTCFKFHRADNTFLVKRSVQARLAKVLSQKIRTEQFAIQDEDSAELKKLSSQKELQHEMVMHVDEGTLTLVYHESTESKIAGSLRRLRTPQREIPLSPPVSTFLEVETNLQRFIETFHDNRGFQVKMKFFKDDKDSPILSMTCNRQHTQGAFSQVAEHLSGIQQKDVKISLAEGLYLQSLRGQQELQAIARRRHCVVSVETRAQHVLLRASHREDVVVVCEGSLASCCPQVFILPLCAGQTQWPPQYRNVMHRGPLSSNVKDYARLIGPPPKPWTFTMTLNCGNDKRSIIVMYVPTTSNGDDFHQQLKASCKAAVQSAIDAFPEGEIVLPIASVDGVPLKHCALPVLRAVKDTARNRSDSAIYAKLFFDEAHKDVPETLTQMEENFCHCGWLVDRFEGATNREARPTSSKDPGDLGTATLRLVGLKEDVTSAAEEVTAVDSPPEYKDRAEEFKTTSVSSGAGTTSEATRRTTIPKSKVAMPVSSRQHSVQTPAISAQSSLGPSQQELPHQAPKKFPSAEAANVSSSEPQQKLHTQDNSSQIFTRIVDSKEADALKVLMKDDFSKIKEEKVDSEKIKLCCFGPSAAYSLKRIDSLRQMEVPLGQDDLQKIPRPFATTGVGVPAYVVPVPHQGKVIIFTFGFSGTKKAKHLLDVKLGKIKPLLTVSQRCYEDTSTKGVTTQSSISASEQSSSTGKSLCFITWSGMKVIVYKADIIKLHVDAVVTAANENPAPIRGPANSTARDADNDLEKQNKVKVYFYITGRDWIGEQVLVTAEESLPWNGDPHAVVSYCSGHKDTAVCHRRLVDIVYKCLKKAHTLGLTSLAIPVSGTDIFGVPTDVCADSYLCAAQLFDRECGRNTSLTWIHFVDANDDMINTIRETFLRKWGTELVVGRPTGGM